MQLPQDFNNEFQDNGFGIIEDVFSAAEINSISSLIDKAEISSGSFRKSGDLYAIRRFLHEIPAVAPQIFNEKLKSIISQLFGDKYFVVKSIYFDKPEKSNWFVAWHQDLTIAVDKKADIPGFDKWTNKNGNMSVQPPIDILKENFTIRIHLDDTSENNGALKVIPGSHINGIRRIEEIDLSSQKAVTCAVKAGGAMLMWPLLFHASDRTTSLQRRRVIHLEFSRSVLPDGIEWAEKT